MAKSTNRKGAISRIYGSNGGLFEGGLLTICSSRGRVIQGGGLFLRGGAIW